MIGLHFKAVLIGQHRLICLLDAKGRDEQISLWALGRHGAKSIEPTESLQALSEPDRGVTRQHVAHLVRDEEGQLVIGRDALE
jgi:hypothetical protein